VGDHSSPIFTIGVKGFLGSNKALDQATRKPDDLSRRGGLFDSRGLSL